MKSDEIEDFVSSALEERGLNPDVDVVPNENEYIVKFRHVEDCDGCEGDDEWLWRIGSEFVYYGQTDEEVGQVVEKKVTHIEDRNEQMHARRDFPSKKFYNWLEEQGTDEVPVSEVRENYPGFFEAYDLGVVTMTVEEGENMVPVRDFKDCVKFGSPKD